MDASQIKLAIKVDVDTYEGTGRGVPKLLDIFEARGIKASFFLSLGPDNSGRAIFRVFTRPGFLKKMFRTKAPSTYGLKTLMMGTVLPAPIIGPLFEPYKDRFAAAGHETGLHAWDHVKWHDRLWKMNPDEVRAELHRGMEAFAGLTGKSPLGFAAPAWRISESALTVLEDSPVVYISTTRGRRPFYPIIDGRRFHILEIPTTLPTADEVLGLDGLSEANLSEFFLERILVPGRHVLTIHAEMEGRALAPVLEKILDVCLARKVSCLRMIDLAREVLVRPEEIPACEILRTEIPGRAGRVSHQAP